MNKNELAIVVFPVVAAVVIGGLVWVVTASAVGRSRARQALRRVSRLSNSDDLEFNNDVNHTEAGSYFQAQQYRENRSGQNCQAVEGRTLQTG